MKMMSLYLNLSPVIIDDKIILQTFIFSNNNDNRNNTTINSVKTIIEYTTDNVQNFTSITTGSLYLDLFDVTRNYLLSNITLDLDLSPWNTLSASGSTQGSTLYTSIMFDGLYNNSPNYDCIWQFRCTKLDTTPFDCRLNGLQYLFYTVETL